jgi:hypothetical protein
MTPMVELVQTRPADGLFYFASGIDVRSIYPGPKPLDPMRKFLMNVAVSWWHAGWCENATSGHYHPEQLFDVVVGMVEARGYARDEALIKSTESATIYCTELRDMARSRIIVACRGFSSTWMGLRYALSTSYVSRGYGSLPPH